MPESPTDRGQVAGQPARDRHVHRWMTWVLLVPCLVCAGQVVVDLDPDGELSSAAAGSARTESLRIGSQASTGRFLVALPPLSRVASITLAFSDETSAAPLPCSAAVPGSEVSQTAHVYRESDSGGLAFIECWGGASESLPDACGQGSRWPARLEVGFEPLPRAERIRRERLVNWRAFTNSSARVFANPTDVRTWYSPPDTNLSSLFGGDTVPYDFEFAELADVPLRSQVVILAHIGGWGNVPIEKADDLLPTIEGIKQYLSTRDISSVVVPFYRTRGGIMGKLRTVSELFELHHSDASRLTRDINRFLNRHPQQRVIMVGLSNGAAFADEVMQRLPETTLNRVCAIEVGPPFLSPSDADESVLRLSNQDRDPVVTGEYWVLMRVRIEGLFRGIYAGLTGRKRTKAGAYVTEHEYAWPNVRQEVVSFLDRWLGR